MLNVELIFYHHALHYISKLTASKRSHSPVVIRNTYSEDVLVVFNAVFLFCLLARSSSYSSGIA